MSRHRCTSSATRTRTCRVRCTDLITVLLLRPRLGIEHRAVNVHHRLDQQLPVLRVAQDHVANHVLVALHRMPAAGADRVEKLHVVRVLPVALDEVAEELDVLRPHRVLQQLPMHATLESNT